MKQPLIFAITLTTLLAMPAMANFDLPGHSKISYPTGINQEVNFGFKWQKKEGKFTIGENTYNIAQIPESYSLALTLSNDDQQVYVQEFAKGYFSEFEWKIGEHLIALRKKRFKVPVRGDYVLSVNGSDYFLAGRNASIKFVFKEGGIDYIIPIGITKDMGQKK